jgi:hypothetical protein
VPLLEGKLVSDCIVHPPSKQVACLEEKAGRETPATFRTLAISTLDGSAAVQRIALPLRATELLSWSPDGRFVIGGFFYPELENKPEQEGDPFRVGAIDTLTGQVLKSVIPGLIDSIVWLDNTRAILSFHAGPDAGAWLVGITHANLTSRKFQGWETQEGSQGNQWRYKAVNQLPGGEVIGLQWKVSKQYPGVREELKFEWIVISTQTPYQVRRLAALNMGSLPCCENWPDLPVLDASVDPSKVWGVIAFPHFRGGLGYAVCDLENGQTTATNIPATGEVFYYSIGELYFTMAVGTQYAVIGTSSGLYRLDRNGKSAFLAQGKVSRVQLIATDFLTEEEKIR